MEAGKTTPEPAKFSEVLRSSQGSSRPKPTEESPSERNERRGQLKEVVRRKVTEATQVLLKKVQLTVPRRFDERANVKTLHPMLTPAGRKALDYCQHWMENPTKLPGPLLMGKSGTFKTHLVWATARQMRDRAEEAIRDKSAEIMRKTYAEIEDDIFVSPSSFHVPSSLFPALDLVVTDGAQIAHDVRSSVERHNLDEVVERYRQFGKEPAAAALFVDDVEVMKLSDWLHEELYRIFDYRYQERMPTFIATNLSSEELRNHLGDRVARRIIDMTEPFKL